jgi:spore germination cell wall hydrolase CwlJ-like protein
MKSLRPTLTLGLCCYLTACAPDQDAPAMEPPSRRAAVPAVPQSDFACLSEAIYFEAGSKGEAGRIAVASVIMNRVADTRFPDTVCGVISEGEAKGVCQFSYRCTLDPSVIIYPNQMKRARKTAMKTLSNQSPDPTDGAIFFHAAYAAPGWFATRERVGEIGGNIFYR